MIDVPMVKAKILCRIDSENVEELDCLVLNQNGETSVVKIGELVTTVSTNQIKPIDIEVQTDGIL